MGYHRVKSRTATAANAEHPSNDRMIVKLIIALELDAV